MTSAIRRAEASDAPLITALTGELLEEIQQGIGEPVFSFEPAASHRQLERALQRQRCIVLLCAGKELDPQAAADAAGFLSLCEGFALYAGGDFGIITELYVRPRWRGRGIGRELLAAARQHGRRQGWIRLEVTTPPLPAFARTLAFYERDGFAVSGGRKLRCLIEDEPTP